MYVQALAVNGSNLSSLRRSGRHVVAIVAQYCFHHHDARLPSLALLLLKRISALVSMPILACLGGHAEPVRDILLLRLQARTEVCFRLQSTIHNM